MTIHSAVEATINPTTIDATIAILSARIVAGQKIDPKEIAALVDHHQDNSLLRTFAISNKIMTAREFSAAIHRSRVGEALGSVPSTPAQFLAVIVEKRRMGVEYGGMITQKSPISALLQVNDPTLSSEAREVLQRKIVSNFPPNVARQDFEVDLRTTRDELGLGFSDSQITDAVTMWTIAARKARLYELSESVGLGAVSDAARASAEPLWDALAEKVFDCSIMSAPVIIAILKKFVWQVKRKLGHLQVTDHLMVVICGPQGSGKSTLVERFCSPLSELMAKADFKSIEDEKIIDLWRNFIVFLDEMGFASKSDVDAIKNVITASTLNRRPMRTNNFDIVKQSATFIGCSNKEMDQLITDPTGVRRFVGLRMPLTACRETVNTLDFLTLWRSVDAHAADPTKPYEKEIRAFQESARVKSSVEEWGAQFRPADHLDTGDFMPTNRLFLIYSLWEKEHFPQARFSLATFKAELNRLIENSPGSVPFEVHRTSTARGYRFTGTPAKLRVVR